MQRPNPDKFLDNNNFLIGKFKALYKAGEHAGNCGGGWMGHQYMIRRGWKLFGIEEVVNGIMDHQNIWCDEQIKSTDTKISENERVIWIKNSR